MLGCLIAAGSLYAQFSSYQQVKYPGAFSSFRTDTAATYPSIYGALAGSSYPFTVNNLVIQGANGSSNDVVIATGTTPSANLVVKSAGLVGIGTTAPGYKLDVLMNSSQAGYAFRVMSADNRFIVMNTKLPSGSFNSIVKANDQGIIYSGGTVGTGGLVIAPWLAGPAGIRMDSLGNVGIGTANPVSTLSVKGTVTAMKLKVTQSGWADFVFDPGYHVPSLYEVESYIKENKHLPDVPSAAVIEKEGQDVGEMNKILLQKLEEMTLQLIRLQREVDELKSKK
ncbi:hypothetical protein DXN04_22370 [Chitinophaga silvisoli]|uniref:Tail fiber domain-containing protein n=2 Tax=Chitinophaga silvisoli TaxID=2291814 RepID=A0A3E1NX62_9BACT|nr:hypothetical protein DXN04_22370 [Chitinophaga silvisoli]